MNKATTISEGQSLLDVALQEMGSIAALFDLADAAGLTITAGLLPGQVLPVPESPSAVPAVAGYYVRRAYRVNTGGQPATPAPVLPAPVGTDYTYDDFLLNDYL